MVGEDYIYISNVSSCQRCEAAKGEANGYIRLQRKSAWRSLIFLLSDSLWIMIMKAAAKSYPGELFQTWLIRNFNKIRCLVISHQQKSVKGADFFLPATLNPYLLKPIFLEASFIRLPFCNRSCYTLVSILSHQGHDNLETVVVVLKMFSHRRGFFGS